MSRPKNIAINPEAIRPLLEEFSMNESAISRLILGHDRSYLRVCLREKKMSADSLEKLCEALNVPKEKVTLTQKEEIEEKEEKAEAKSGEMNVENLIVGLNSMYNLHNKMLTELKTQNIILRELIQNIKDLRITANNINSNVSTTTEKVKAIFTEVKYNK